MGIAPSILLVGNQGEEGRKREDEHLDTKEDCFATDGLPRDS
jgi:hypothetical protein